jgi:DNA (cytosine-5)-methyltransferase 1
VDNPFKSPAVISFCPGILGIERGLKRAGINTRVVAYVEIEAFIISNLVAGMEAGILDPAPIWTDVKTFPREYFFRRIHGIIGGYPCTPFSVAGQRKGEEDERHLWPYISAAIRSTEPIWCFFENVSAHLTMGFGSVSGDLRSMGYNVEAGIYTAEETGAPHERKRLFILAITNRFDWGLSESKEWFKSIQASRRSEELVNSNLSEGRANLTAGYQRNGNNTRWQEKAGGFESSSKESLANIFSEGLEVRQQQSTREKQQTTERGRSWPARPGEQQHEWEEPRTIESGVGCTIDGYNFREDILRALGNSVVEQTAELAFIDLLNKHLKNL